MAVAAFPAYYAQLHCKVNRLSVDLHSAALRQSVCAAVPFALDTPTNGSFVTSGLILFAHRGAIEPAIRGFSIVHKLHSALTSAR